MNDGRLRIGEFAAAAGCRWTRSGSTSDAALCAGRRALRVGIDLDGRDLDRIHLARQFQQLGLTVAEVVEALAAHDLGGATCSSERWRIEQVEARIESQMAELRRTVAVGARWPRASRSLPLRRRLPGGVAPAQAVRGAYMMTATPTRQMRAPMMS